jgi:hypothetical protein
MGACCSTTRRSRHCPQIRVARRAGAVLRSPSGGRVWRIICRRQMRGISHRGHDSECRLQRQQHATPDRDQMICAPSTSSVVLALTSALRDRGIANPAGVVSCKITYCVSEPMYWIEAREEVRPTLAEILTLVLRRAFPIQRRRWVLHAGQAQALVNPTSKFVLHRLRGRRKGPHRLLPAEERLILPAAGRGHGTRARYRT